jgi:hypothetical protein
MSPRTFLFPLLLLSAPLFAQGEVDLRTTAKKGSSVWLAHTMKQEQNIDMGGQQMESGNVVTRTLHVAVKDVDDKGNLVVETKIARVQGSASIPMMGDTEFDSAEPAAADEEDDGMGGMTAMIGKSMMAGAGKTFTAKVSPYGKVIELMADAKELLAGAEKGPMGAGFDESTMKQLIEGTFGKLPEKPTAVGAKWADNEQESGSRVPMKRNIEMALAKADAELFEITATGTLEQVAQLDGAGAPQGDDEEAAMAREAMKSMKIKNGKANGTLKVSRTDGFVLESSLVVTMDVEMSAGPMGDMQMAMKITTSTKRSSEEAATPKKAAAPAKTDGGEKKEGK